MANIDLSNLPRSNGPLPINYFDLNWANNVNLNKLFPGESGGGLVPVDVGYSEPMYLPGDFVRDNTPQHTGPAPGGGSFANRLAGMGSGSQAKPAPTINGMSFADYLNQIGVHVPGSTGNPSTDPNNAVAQIMAGFSTPSVGGIGGLLAG